MSRKRQNRVSRLSCLVLTCLVTASAWAGPPQPASDEEIKSLLAKAGNAEDYPGSSVLYVLDEADVYVQSSGLATTESCQIIKILTDAGIRSRSVLRHEFDPDTNRVAIRRVAIHRADGTIDEVPLTNVIGQPTTQSMIYWGGEQYLLSIPRLSVGDALEIRLSKIGFNIAYLDNSGASVLDPSGLQPPMPGHWYEVTEFQTGSPIMQKRYSVYMPSDMPVQYEVYNGSLKSSLWFDEDQHVYTFSDEDIPPIKSEPHMVARSDVVTKLVMATVGDWEAKSRWFYEVNEPQFDADEAIRAKVEEITAHLPNEEAKIHACLHWVADNIRYYGTSRGPCEGFTLHTGIETFHDKGGVCKDIAGMLVTMLRVLGHEVYPALTMAGSRVEEIPADQFNHTVTVIRNPDGTFRVLDPTWSPTSKELWSSREALQGLVYGTPEGQDLTLSPYFSPEENLLRVHSECTLDENGDLRSDMRMDMTGYPCTYLRRYANRDRPFDQRARFETNLNIAPNAQLVHLEHIDPHDYSQDGWLEMSITAPEYAAGHDGQYLFQFPLLKHPLKYMLLGDFNYNFSRDRRQFGLRMRASRLVDYKESITLPAGWQIDELPEDYSFDSDSASLDFSARQEGNTLVYHFRLAVKDHIIDPDTYPGFKTVMDKMNELADTWILCIEE